MRAAQHQRPFHIGLRPAIQRTDSGDLLPNSDTHPYVDAAAETDHASADHRAANRTASAGCHRDTRAGGTRACPAVANSSAAAADAHICTRAFPHADPAADDRADGSRGCIARARCRCQRTR